MASLVKKHKRRVKLDCGKTNKEYPNLNAVSRGYECDLCSNIISTKSYLKVHMRNHTQDKPFECKICSSKFTLKGTLNVHMKTHTGDKPHDCDICNSKFTLKGALNVHMRTHTGEKPYECDICNSKFTLKGALNVHMRTHTGDKPYECNICNSKFSTKGNLKKHMRTHTGDKPYECNICNSKFSTKGNLKKHMRNHTGEKPYECNICNSKFTQKSSLNVHMRTHTGDKPYECNICNSKFTQKGNLNVHMTTHTGDKPYDCDICNSKFTSKPHLIRHMRNHTGEKPYECNFCNSKFTLKGTLNVHMRTHTGDKPYECDICNSKFSKKDHLNVHMRTHTGDKPYKCNICNSKFTHKRNLNVHMRTHTGDKPYECDICNSKFTNKHHLNAHMTTHTGDKPYDCDICNSKFTRKGTLNVHMRTHTMDKPYECDICNSKFSKKGHLNVHMKTHSGDTPFECNICNAKLTQRGALTKHMRIHTLEKLYECEMCRKNFTCKGKLNIHVKGHYSDRFKMNDVCEKRLIKNVSVDDQKKNGKNSLLRKCEICKLLKRHIQHQSGVYCCNICRKDLAKKEEKQRATRRRNVGEKIIAKRINLNKSGKHLRGKVKQRSLRIQAEAMKDCKVAKHSKSKEVLNTLLKKNRYHRNSDDKLQSSNATACKKTRKKKGINFTQCSRPTQCVTGSKKPHSEIINIQEGPVAPEIRLNASDVGSNSDDHDESETAENLPFQSKTGAFMQLRAEELPQPSLNDSDHYINSDVRESDSETSVSLLNDTDLFDGVSLGEKEMNCGLHKQSEQCRPLNSRAEKDQVLDGHGDIIQKSLPEMTSPNKRYSFGNNSLSRPTAEILPNTEIGNLECDDSEDGVEVSSCSEFEGSHFNQVSLNMMQQRQHGECVGENSDIIVNDDDTDRDMMEGQSVDSHSLDHNEYECGISSNPLVVNDDCEGASSSNTFTINGQDVRIVKTTLRENRRRRPIRFKYLHPSLRNVFSFLDPSKNNCLLSCHLPPPRISGEDWQIILEELSMAEKDIDQEIVHASQYEHKVVDEWMKL